MKPSPDPDILKAERPVQPDRRTFMLQVILPLILGILILAGGIVLVWQTGTGTASAWADASLIFLLIPWLCLGLLPLAILLALWYGIFKLTAWVPAQLRKADEYIALAGGYLRRGTDIAVKPMFAIKGAWAVVSAFFRGLISLVGLQLGGSDE